ncbi:hypothetical protein V6N12_026230 [Hibiscus sabdariffa]|uniref:Hexosyltransferase n=1 Tax=Hibiscus sabdariffa TaxID=183260 RepID=A0ABR2DR68_9ROSI
MNFTQGNQRNEDYVKGVVGFAKGLRKVKSKYPLVVAVLSVVPEDHHKILLAEGCIVKENEPVYPLENQIQFAMAYYVINYSFQAMYQEGTFTDPSLRLGMAMQWRHPENIDPEKAKVIHYCAAGSKPWRFTGKEENTEREDIKKLVTKW